MLKILQAVTILTVLAACASSGMKPYAPAGEPDAGGYYDQDLGENRFRIVYKAPRGRENTAEDTAKDYALLRAAELTFEKGYVWFELVDLTSEDTFPRSEEKSVNGILVQASAYRECGILVCREIVRPSYFKTPKNTQTQGAGETIITILEIITGDGEKPRGGNFYDAQMLAQTIRARN